MQTSLWVHSCEASCNVFPDTIKGFGRLAYYKFIISRRFFDNTCRQNHNRMRYIAPFEFSWKLQMKASTLSHISWTVLTGEFKCWRNKLLFLLLYR